MNTFQLFVSHCVPRVQVKAKAGLDNMAKDLIPSRKFILACIHTMGFYRTHTGCGISQEQLLNFAPT